MARDQLVLRKEGKPDRVCYPFPWNAHNCPKPWKNGYERIIVPLNDEELRTAKPTTKAHILIVKRSKLALLKGK